MAGESAWGSTVSRCWWVLCVSGVALRLASLPHRRDHPDRSSLFPPRPSTHCFLCSSLMRRFALPMQQLSWLPTESRLSRCAASGAPCRRRRSSCQQHWLSVTPSCRRWPSAMGSSGGLAVYKWLMYATRVCCSALSMRPGWAAHPALLCSQCGPGPAPLNPTT